MAGPSPGVVEMVELNAQEERIFNTLKQTLAHFGLKTQLRVAGGWVRDKLLRRDSGDIDIALDDQMGVDFAEKVNEYLRLRGEQTREIGHIKSNPDQSKHLETAKVKIHGTEIDFVNLRSETYAEGSRIPEATFGTAEQDAFRRDLTINSLFYNIGTGEVEDLTGKGKADLLARVIRTPLPPRTTFLDDPLRVLRAVRFGARFGFTLDPELVEAASSAEVRAALGTKVSRERMGVEIDLMLKGPDPVGAMRWFDRCGLFSTIFQLPPNCAPAEPQTYGQSAVASLASSAALLDAWPKTEVDSQLPPELRRIFLLAALLLPVKAVTYKEKKSMQPVSKFVIREGLKLPAKDADRVAALHVGSDEFAAAAPALLSPDEEAATSTTGDGMDSLSARRRITAGHLVRRLKELWHAAAILSAVSALSSEPSKPSDAAETAALLVQSVREMGLDRAWEMKPLLDGKAIMAMVGKPGPQIAELTQKVLDWQFAHPKGSVQECSQWLEGVWRSLGSSEQHGNTYPSKKQR
ncbi:Polynucleotide adenylyltransferase family protein [Klebsormidium nitens]|uniref:Polynucleotide adenylyltransferase family protein n=1 Tax=Klebsormidium nitens TaxID=105231 RepID=A0A1Y1I910_KLENI|nr:Polynucleotide adenylyltransferase family protein [Klebsormidium nitens]|eukprot:GAQ85176.1 Polynucleotide adenylyltransferase family protein [Klebsormidium nitens]